MASICLYVRVGYVDLFACACVNSFICACMWRLSVWSRVSPAWSSVGSWSPPCGTRFCPARGGCARSTPCWDPSLFSVDRCPATGPAGCHWTETLKSRKLSTLTIQHILWSLEWNPLWIITPLGSYLSYVAGNLTSCIINGHFFVPYDKKKWGLFKGSFTGMFYQTPQVIIIIETDKPMNVQNRFPWRKRTHV